MPDSKAVIEIKVNGETIIHADTEYIADNCFINEKDSWTQHLNINGNIELIITPSIEPLTLWDRIRLFFWGLLYKFDKRKAVTSDG